MNMTEREYKQGQKETETRFSDYEYSLMGWNENRKSYVVVYNVIGVLHIVRNGHICSVPKRYYFDNLEDAVRHYNRLCKYRPLFVA
jgi:predicted HD phosphohydrolase